MARKKDQPLDATRKFTPKMYPAKCNGCGKETEAPYEQTADRPVLCKDCLAKRAGS